MERNRPPQVVCDAGPIIHLDELGCLDLLADFADVLVPESVWQEVVVHRSAALDHDEVRFVQTPVAMPQDAEFTTLVRAFSLDAGEQEALALVRRQSTAILLTDDAAARLVAEQLGMRVHGTIGILLRAIRRQSRTPQQVLSLLRLLPEQSTLYIRPSLLNQVIARVQTESGLG